MYFFGIIALIWTSILRARIYFETHWTGNDAAASGKPYRYKCSAGGRRNRASTRIAVDFSTPLRMVICHENWWEYTLKCCGFTEEFETGVEDFDDKFLIECDHQGVCMVLQMDASARKLIAELLGKDDRKIIVGHNGISLVDSAHMLQLKTVEKLAEQLYALKAKLENAALQPYTPRGRTASVFVGVVHTLLAVGVVGVLLHVGGEVELASYTQLLKDTAMATGLFWAGWLLVIGALLGRTVMGRRAVVDFVVFGAPAAMILICIGLIDINVRYDTASPRQFTMPVIQKYTTRGRRSTHYHVIVRHWDTPSAGYDFSSHALFNAAEVGGRVSFAVHPGYLGYPWLTDVRAGR